MSDDTPPSLESLAGDLAEIGMIMAKTFMRLPIPISIISRRDDLLNVVSEEDVLTAGNLVADMPGISDGLSDAMHHAAWTWVSAGNLIALYKNSGMDVPAWCALYQLAECGDALERAKAKIKKMNKKKEQEE